MKRNENLLLYRPNRPLLERVLKLCRTEDALRSIEADRAGKDKITAEFCASLAGEYTDCVGEIIELGESHGFGGNLWHDTLTYYLVYHENAFSKSCEIRGHVDGGMNALVVHDMELFRKWFSIDFSAVERHSGTDLFQYLKHYKAAHTGKKLFNTRIAARICELAAALAGAEDTAAFVSLLEEFYGEYGVGKFGLHKAFRIREIPAGQGDPGAGSQMVDIYPITNIAHVNLDDLVGYESAKKKLIDNTEAFVAGRKANNCLLFGDAGTGKSSSIKAILNRYYDRGLRIIEIYRHQFRDLSAVIDQIKNRNYRFIIYMDDLSFEAFETEYKYLKAVIEGGLEKKPDNILIYATSNRRHLIREEYADKLIDGDDIRQDMHTSDTVQEKLSLVYRFGVTIYFGAPDKKEFQNIVRTLARRENVKMDEDRLLLLANKWELNHGGFSGRTAQQFIDYLQGFENPDELTV